MKHSQSVLWGSLTCLAAIALAQTGSTDQKTAILTVFKQQEMDWNQGNLEAFTGAFKKTPDILFVGPDLYHGYSNVLENFRHNFPNRESMGTLSFSQEEVQPLDQHFATATAHFHLQRSEKAGGDADGYFMVVLHRLRTQASPKACAGCTSIARQD